MILSTLHRLSNAPYPVLQVTWRLDRDSLGWTGTARIWLDANQSDINYYIASIRQTVPLGAIVVTLDPVGPGCWATAQFEGVSIQERDLQWAALWAGEAIKRKREFGERK